jgi:hypothetical protein
MATHVDQHKAINKPEATTRNGRNTQKEQQKINNLTKSQAKNTTKKTTHKIVAFRRYKTQLWQI